MDTYKKKYKEALERARVWKEKSGMPKDKQGILDDIFPELAESEDERIRKSLIILLQHFCKGYRVPGLDFPVSYKDMLAWLEKQGKSSDQIHYWTEEEIEPIISDYLRGAEHYGGMIGRLRCLKPKSLENQSEQKPNPYSGTSFEYNGHTWGMCARDNGVDILCDKHIIGHLEKQGEAYTKKDIDNAWLKGMCDAKREFDKQSDSPIKWNKNTKDCKPKVSHSVLMKTTHGIAEGEWQGEHWHQYRWAALVRDTDVLSWIELSDLEKQGEQKPTIEMKSAEEILGIDSETYNKIVDECIYGEQKVEPKFKVGDWITNGDYTWKIVEVKPLDYILQSQDGNIVDDTISHVDEQFHSFTIEDAKEGDVLASKDKLCILIFRNLDTSTSFSSYYNIAGKGEFGWSNDCFTPATKEQCDLLFQKMKEVGYEWDADKKELKKISQRMISAEAKEAMYDKPAWSEENDVMIYKLLAVVELYYDRDGDDLDKQSCIDWLKSLKQRIGG